MFGGISGTSIVILGVDKGVVVGADKRAGNTLSKVISDTTTKLLPIHPYGVVTGCGLAALYGEGTDVVRVDMFKMLRRICRHPQFRFGEDDFRAVCHGWRTLMWEHLGKCEAKYWPETPECGYWFKTIFVFQKAGRIEGWILKFEYELRYPQPGLHASFASIDDEYVNQGHLLLEGDQRGGEYLAKHPEDSLLLPETHSAWNVGINAAGISIEKGARIVKDALYVNHLYSTKPDGESGVGPTCDIAFIDRQVGFYWYEQNVSSRPPEVVNSR